MKRSQRATGSSRAPATGVTRSCADLALTAIAPRAVVIRTRRMQRIALKDGAGELAFIVQSGVLTLEATLPGPGRRILGILYPGDVLRASQMPPLPAMGLKAVAASGEIWRLRWAQIEALVDGDSQVARYLLDRLAEQGARLAMHAAVIGSLTGEERVASLFIEMAERIGTVVPGVLAFDIPLSRSDIADYLALNADTVSRIVSRLKAKGIVSQSGRGRFVCRDRGALAGESPIAQALTALHRQSQGSMAV